ncbi:acbd6, partial [Symbiodinium microadriaticum]
DGNTPLMWALRGQSSRHRVVMELLLDRKVDVNLANNEGVTALHKASQCGYAKIVAKITEAGADVMATDNVQRYLSVHCTFLSVLNLQDGKTPVDVAKDDTIRHLLTNLHTKREMMK